MSFLLALVTLVDAQVYRAPTGKYPVLSAPGNVWVYFTDKGFRNEEQTDLLLSRLPSLPDAMSLERRFKAMGRAYDFDDLPPFERYVSAIQDLGAELRTKSSWLNAASFRMTPGQAAAAARLPFVYKIETVTSRWEPTGEKYWPLTLPTQKKHSRDGDTTAFKDLYGLAYAQNYMLGVPQANASGVIGSSVRLGLLDTGLKRRHPAVSGIRIAGEHDFISSDRFALASVDQPSASVTIDQSQIGLIESPAVYRNADSIVVLFVADTSQSDAPVRTLFRLLSTDNGTTWTSPEGLLAPDLNNSAVHQPAIAGKGDHVYAVWQMAHRLEDSPYIWQGYFVGNVWQGGQQLQAGRTPDMCLKGDSLFLVSVGADSFLLTNSASISNGAPVWGTGVASIPPDGYSFSEMVKEPSIAKDDAGHLFVTVTGWRTGKIYLYRSTDDGNTFEELTTPVPSGAEKARLRFADGQLHLIYKDYGQTPLVGLSSQTSTDGQQWTKSPIVESLLGITSFDLIAGSDLKVAYETEGRIYVRSSTDGGQTWIAGNGFGLTDFSSSPRWIDDSRLIWFEKGDSNTDVEPADTMSPGRFGSNQADHGTRMASIIGGWRKGSMVGVAPGTEFLIAKTEFNTFRTTTMGYEFLIEEDNYIAGLEWAERHGASIISSSLGYTGWYQPSDFDGKTAPISVAAGRAVERGVLVVTAMGNRDTTRYTWEEPYIVAPGDAFNVITVGGVEKDSLLWHTPGGGGTGRGPTSDGRHKPDLVAMGDSVTVVAPDSTTNVYEGSSGTSGATALIAGCCVLLKDAHPEWTAVQIRDTLFAYATQANAPDDSFGHGIPNVYRILQKYPPVGAVITGDQIGAPFPNPFVPGQNTAIYFPIELAAPTAFAQLSIFTLSGELVDSVTIKGARKTGSEQYLTAPGSYADKDYLKKIGAYWNGTNIGGKNAASGLYYAALKTGGGTDVKVFALVR